MAGYGPPTTGFSRSLKRIGDKLAAQFGDRIDVKYVWNIMDFGYKAEEIVWLVEDGVLTLGYQSSSYLTDRVPELSFVDLPFLFRDNDHARGAMDGALGKRLVQAVESKANFRILGWYGILAPPNTPAAIIQKLRDEVAKALAPADVVEALAKQGMEPRGTQPAEWAKYMDSEKAFYTKVIKDAGIKPPQ